MLLMLIGLREVGLGAMMIRRERSAVTSRAALFLVQGKGVDIASVCSGFRGAKIENPNNLKIVSMKIKYAFLKRDVP